MKILLTRTKENNLRSAVRLNELGFETVSLPLGGVVDTGNVVAGSLKNNVIITSSNAVKILAARNEQFNGSFYVVGERAKQAIEKFKLGNVCHVAPNAKMLAEHLSKNFTSTSFNYLAGVDRSFDFTGYFDSFKKRANFVECTEVYKIIREVPEESVLKDSVLSCENGIQLHYSTASAAYFFDLIRKFGLSQCSKTMHAVTISNKTSSAVDFSLVKSVQSAKIENESGMFDLLQKFHF